MHIAKEKMVYQDFYKADLTEIQEFPDQLFNQYDIVTCAGIVLSHHMDYQLFEEMILASKKGGLIIFAARSSYIGSYWYSEVIEKIEKDGRWKLLDSHQFHKYEKLEKSIGRFSRMPCTVFVYQNLQENRRTYRKFSNNSLQSIFS